MNTATHEVPAGRSVIAGSFASIDAEITRRQTEAVRAVLASRAHEQASIDDHHREEYRAGLDSRGRWISR